MDKKLKAAIAGYGYMGQIRRKVIEKNPYLELAGICEPDSLVRNKIEGCPVFESFDELFRQDIDVMFVCTPNCYSPAIVIKSLKAGRHVFCEKPPGTSSKDVIDMIEAEQSGVAKLMFGFNHRFHPGVIKAKVIAASARMGRIISVRGIYGKSGGLNFKHSWRNNKDISGGGILLDQGIHMLDLFLYFCGDFEEVKCFLSRSFWKFNVEDNACVVMKNNSQQTALLHSSATLWKHTFRMDIILEEGYMIVEGLLSKSGSYGREKLIVGRRQFEDEADAVGNPSEEVTYFDRDLSWDMEVEEFIKCINSNSPVKLSSSADALKVMKVIEKAYADAEPAGRFSDEKHCHI